MPVTAYVLVQTGPGKSWDVAEATSKLEGVKMVHAVTGVFDVIAFVEVADLDALKGLVAKIHAIEGTQRTQTAISI